MFLFVHLVWLHFGFANIYSYITDLMSKHSMLFMYHSLIVVNQKKVLLLPITLNLSLCLVCLLYILEDI